MSKRFFDELYPMSYVVDEAQRLDVQACELHDPRLQVLARRASAVLEIGCGVGSNLNMLRAVSIDLDFTGLDLNEFAIEQARENHRGDSRAKFVVGDALALPFPERSFDLVLIKLVLWSVGPRWREVLREAYRVLKPGGVLYSFEPDDSFLFMEPPKAAFQVILREWQDKVLAAGLDPFIGKKVFAACQEAGFSETYVRPFQKVSTGEVPADLLAHRANLEKIFLGRGPQYIGRRNDDSLFQAAQKELREVEPKDLLIETHIVSIARKDHSR